jgi:very-short-patch-repair endonuclease
LKVVEFVIIFDSMVDDKSIRINNLPHLKTFRITLRKNLTPAEATLWKFLKGSKLEGRKFRRQHSVGNYILDFYCPSERLAIELDGEVHFNERAMEYDYERKLFLNSFDIKVIRFENRLVFEETEYVLNRIVSYFGWQDK